MNLLNGLFTAAFGVVLRPIEAIGGAELAIAVTSAFFGVLALFVFKHISWQAGIKGTKDRIKGHLIEIRIYQDDLLVVGKSVGKILLRNFQYLSLNFGPFLPLALPFTVVAAQLVVRYGFEPVPLTEDVAAVQPGDGTMLEVLMAPGHEAEVTGLTVRFPDGLRAMSKLVRATSDGRAFQEFVAVESGEWTIEVELADGTVFEKRIATGDVAPRAMQPERVASFWSAWLWPAEDTLPEPLAKVSFPYPNRSLAFLPDGPLGVLVGLLVWSMIFGFAALKPLGVTV